jgi:hypothetical protein
LDLRGRKWQEAGEACMMRSLIICMLHHIIGVMKSRRVRQVGHVACMGEMRNAYEILVRKLKGKRLHGRLRHR